MSVVPSVSIVVTCYNYGRFLRGCLESVLAQTYRDYEVLVIDDGSTDDSVEIAREFVAGERIRLHERENGGQAKAKNDGIRLARGAYIAFLDADDYWESDKLQRQVELLEGGDAGVVFSRSRQVNEAGKPVGSSSNNKYLLPRRGDVTGSLIFDNFVPFSSSVVRRECFEQLGVFDENLAMAIDWDLWLRFSIRYKFDFVDAPLFSYRVGHAGQMSKNRERRQACCDRIMERFLSQHPGVVPPSVLRRAHAYTWANRGRYYERVDRTQAWRCHARSLRSRPFQFSAIKGLLRLAIRRLPRGHG
ncbi:MAG: glycosyltransferase [Acidobacteriota bacterium]|nr:glycosyltransferase [Acidobacteriota bacterium]